jgi:hypothetical protein
MRRAKKQTTAFGLLLLSAMPLLLSVCIYISQNLLQHKRGERFDTELIQTITISAEKLNWIRAGKEVLVDGRLFDVKSLVINGPDVALTGFYDHKEDNLVKHIKELGEQKQDSNRPVNNLTVAFLLLLQFKGPEIFPIQSSWKHVSCQFPEYAETLINHSYPAPSPPPKFTGV